MTAPYYEDEAVTLYLGDCREILPTLGPVDHVITDPPYAARAMKNARSAESIKQRRDGKIYDFGYAALTLDVRRDAAREFARLARRWVLVWCDLESMAGWRRDIEDAGARYVRMGVWVRQHGAPQFSGDRPGQGAEGCVIAHAKGERLWWNGGGRPAAWVGPIVSGNDPDRLHTSPKPTWLMRALIGDFTDAGETILDPFAGSGTTGRAAKDLGRKAILIEVDERWAETAARRMAQSVMDVNQPAEATV